ncbi:MAG: LTA synthase family protein [Lentisphaeria bacterium]|nr:LTA synthase family protein [Lentisphaeria bacterium]
MSRTTWKERWQRFAAWHPFEHILTGGAALGMILPVVFWIVADPGYTNLIVDMLFTDLLPAAVLMALALAFRSRVLAVTGTVVTAFYLLVKIGTIFLYAESFMPLTFDSLVMLHEHTDHEGVKAMIGEYYYLWGTLAAFLVVCGIVYCCVQAVRYVRQEKRQDRALVCVMIFLALSLIANARYIWYREVNTVVEENYTGHVIMPLSISFAEIVRDGAKELFGMGEEKYGFREIAFAPEEKQWLLEKGLLQTASASTQPGKLPRFDRILILAIESLDGDFLNSNNPEMPAGLTPNLDRLKKEYLSFQNYYSASHPTSWGINSLILSRPDYKPDQKIRNVSICDLFREAGYTSYFLCPVGGEFGDNRKRFHRMLRFDRMLFEEEIRRNYDYATGAGGWGLSDDSMLRVTMDLLRKEKPERYFMLVTTMDSHNPYHASGPTAGEHKFGVPFYDSIHGIDDNIGRFVCDFTADPELFNERTLLIVTADHSASHGKNFTRRKVLASPAKIPLIFITKQKLDGLDPDQLFSTIDLPAAFARMLGKDLPETFCGRDFTTKKPFALCRDISETIYVFFNDAAPVKFEKQDPRPRNTAEKALLKFYLQFYEL